MDDETIARIAAARSAPHAGTKTECFFGDQKVLQNIGVKAEIFFAAAFGLPYDWKNATQRPQGDGGIDFEVRLEGIARPLTIDVKGTKRAPPDLLVKASSLWNKPPPDIYVGVGFKNDAPFFTGWEWGNVVAKMPKQDFGYGKGKEAHMRLYADLQPMNIFCNLMARRVVDYAGPQ